MRPYEVRGVRYQPAEDPTYEAEGLASWYGAELHGRPTASGETFDMNAFTAAHPTLPMSSMLEVTNLANGKVVVVRVNDRGPFTGQRIVDVSRAAAEALDFVRQGTARVKVRNVGSEARPGPMQTAGSPDF